METRSEVWQFRGLDVGQLSNCCQTGLHVPGSLSHCAAVRGAATHPHWPCPVHLPLQSRLCPSWVQSTAFWQQRLLSLAYTLLSPRVQEHLLISWRPDSAGLVCLNTLKFRAQKAHKSAEFHSKMLTEGLQVHFHAIASQPSGGYVYEPLAGLLSSAQGFHCSRECSNLEFKDSSGTWDLWPAFR